MAEAEKMILTSKDCQECEYGSIEEITKAKIIINCSARNKRYYLGQYVQCDDKRKVKHDWTKRI